MTYQLDLVSRSLASRYVVETEAGHGGVAVVYRARDLRHGRLVALKLLRPDLSQSLFRERFEREIEIAARLQHPNILPVFESGEADGVLYYVMPFVDGGSLRGRLMAEAPLPLEESLRLTREIGDALAWAHQRGVVHRDIKPENILLAANHALVADFGIACALAGADGETTVSGERLTEPGTGIGTPEYMSPEQAFGEPTVDGRSDLYSLGCMLYEMVSGAAPFAGLPATAQLLRKTTVAPPPLCDVATVPQHISDAVSRALECDLDRRLPDIATFIKALESPAAIPRPAAAQSDKAPPPAVAVLPFVNLSGDAADEYLSDGLSEELIHALAGVAGLRVLGRTTSFAMKGRNEDARTIGQELAVDAVLQGSVRRSGSRLRITAHLTNTTDAFELWTERYDREMSDVFAVQDEIAGAIAQALTTELLTAERPAASTADPAAYERFLLARHHWNRRTETAMYRSVGLLEESLSLDPGFAPAFAALAESHVTLAVYGAEAPATAMQRARQAADRALALSPRLGEALSARACVRALYDWDWAGAASDFQQAITASPQYPTGYQWFAMNLLVPRQRFPQAFQQLARARELDPLSPVVAISLGLTHFFARDYASAINAFGELLDRDPSFGPAHAFLGQAFTEAGQPDEGIRHLRRALELVGGSVEFDAALGVALARAGDTSGAREVLHRLEQQRAERYVSLVLLAQVHAALGAPDQAVANLRGARDERASDLAWIGVRPAFDPLRGDSGFRALLAEVGLA